MVYPVGSFFRRKSILAQEVEFFLFNQKCCYLTSFFHTPEVEFRAIFLVNQKDLKIGAKTSVFPGGAADRVRHFRFLNDFFLQTLRNVTTRAGRQFTRRNQLIALDLCCQKVKTQVNI